MAKTTTQSVRWTKFALVALAAVVGAVFAHGVQILITGEVNVGVSSGVAAAFAIAVWAYLNRRPTGFTERS